VPDGQFEEKDRAVLSGATVLGESEVATLKAQLEALKAEAKMKKGESTTLVYEHFNRCLLQLRLTQLSAETRH